ncbi:MAG: zinc-dependent peptidase [Marinobacter sp.]|nr:zinc-dependent peptidase [Marinobacter sp.]
MLQTLLFGVAALAIIAAVVIRLFCYRHWVRQRVLKRELPDHWRPLLARQVPIYLRLPDTLKQRLEKHVQLFMAEKTFFGCDGYEVTEPVQLTVAGHACLLILGRHYADYDHVHSVLIYPGAYAVDEEVTDGLVVSRHQEVRSGQASDYGQVILSWEDCEATLEHPGADHNVILHEFAHQLDYLDGSPNGAPPLLRDEAGQWQQVMSTAFAELQATLKHPGRQPWLDPYGATDPAEFFAVLTEAFFQQPRQLKSHQPGVYQQLAHFYNLDPLQFSANSPDGQLNGFPPSINMRE